MFHLSQVHICKKIFVTCAQEGWDAKPMVEWTWEGTLPSQVKSIPTSQLEHALEGKSPYQVSVTSL
ncbi:unnamed protein product [Prunus armeniaca]